MRRSGRIVVFTQGGGHAQRHLPLIAGLERRGFDVHVLTRADVRPQIEAAGGSHVDLFARYPIDAVDRESVPRPCRLVTFAAAYADQIAVDVSKLAPILIVYDSFVVVAPLVARRLSTPYVGMRAGHAQVPQQAIAGARNDPRVSISAACHAAVERLRSEYEMADATPFSYLGGLSPYLNLCPEPEPFLEAEARAAFEPVAFFGSLAPELRDAASHQRPLAGSGSRLRVYVSFGTVVWNYYADTALSAMRTLADVLVSMNADVLVSLGNHALDAAARRDLESRGIRLTTYADQWGALKDADLFVTHHGLNSTHEAIFHQVPMLSYPFLGDQPALARRCEHLGLAVPLATRPRAPLDAASVRRRLDAALAGRETTAARLAEARQWELDTIGRRDAVFDRILGIAGQ